jgi:putative transposase
MSIKHYASNLTDKQWHLITPYMPPEKENGRPRTTDLREVVNTLLYLSRSGCQWYLLPSEFPPRSTVHRYFSIWRDDGTLDEISRVSREKIRIKSGKNKVPSAAIMDSQSVKTVSVSESSGFDGAKLIKGRKRHILVDVLGLVLGVMVHSAAIDERRGTKLLMARIAVIFPSIIKVWADGGYSGSPLKKWILMTCNFFLEIVKSPRKKFLIVKWRWIVERTSGRFNWQR